MHRIESKLFCLLTGVLAATLSSPADGLRPAVGQTAPVGAGATFSFALAADMRNFTGPGTYATSQYFRGAVEAINTVGPADFIISPGDIDPPADTLWTITQTLGSTYTWYPVVGNHELPGQGEEASYGANMAWLRAYNYGAVLPGPTGCPTTTFSFDYQQAHFVVLNEYCDSSGDTATQGDVPDHLYTWLVNDLNNTSQSRIFVIGHEPAYPQPDADNGRLRHETDSLNQYAANRDRFWNLLRDKRITAYLCGHTHDYSAVFINSVWQIDAGHARGLGDTGARSTFVVIYVGDEAVTFETYRDDANGGAYTRRQTGILWSAHPVYLPLVRR